MLRLICKNDENGVQNEFRKTKKNKGYTTEDITGGKKVPFPTMVRIRKECRLQTAKLRGGIKQKKLFFFTFCQKIQTPPPSPFLTTSDFSDKEFFDSAQTAPPLFGENGQKTPRFFITPPPLVGKFCQKI